MMESPQEECPQNNGEGAELIVAYAAGTLDADSQAAFERHLESCASCREVAAAQRAVWSALDQLTPLQVSSNFDAKVYQRISEEQQITWWQRLVLANWSWRPAMPVAAACVLLIAAFLVKNSGPVLAPEPTSQPKLQIEQVERALDDMDLLKQAGVESVLEKATPREQI